MFNSPGGGVPLRRSPWNFQWMSTDGQGRLPNAVEILPNIWTAWVGRTNVTDDRRTGDSIANVNMSSRSLKNRSCGNLSLYTQQQPLSECDENNTAWCAVGTRWSHIESCWDDDVRTRRHSVTQLTTCRPNDATVDYIAGSDRRRHDQPDLTNANPSSGHYNGQIRTDRHADSLLDAYADRHCHVCFVREIPNSWKKNVRSNIDDETISGAITHPTHVELRPRRLIGFVLLNPNTITLASSELASNMFGASSELVHSWFEAETWPMI